MHCHHGKHRGPTAAALIEMDRGWSAAEATEFLKRAGADPRYEGLYADVTGFRPPSAEELRAAPSTFPEVVDTGGLTARMVEIDEAWDRLKKDRTAIASAVQLVEHYREAARLPEVRSAAFLKGLAEAEQTAGELESAIRVGDSKARDTLFDRTAAQCASCHRAFRDRR